VTLSPLLDVQPEWAVAHSFIPCGQGSSLLWTPALRPFELVQCASPGRGGDLSVVCTLCGWRRESRLE